MIIRWIFIFLCALFSACQTTAVQKENSPLVKEAQAFLDSCNQVFIGHWQPRQEAAWQTLQSDSGQQVLSTMPWVLSEAAILRAEALAKKQADLMPMQAQALRQLLYYNSQYAPALPDTLASLAKLLQAQNARYKGESCGWLCAENAFRQQISEKGREIAWTQAHAHWGSGAQLQQMADARNAMVGLSGFPNFYAYRMYAYGLSEEQSVLLCQKLLKELRPLYRELHTYMRLALSRKYKQGMPDLLPAYWLSDLHGFRWHEATGLAHPLADTLAKLPSNVLEAKARAFFQEKKFPALPTGYYRYTPAGRSQSKTFHINKGQDIRVHVGLKSTLPSFSSFTNALTDAYAFQAMSNQDTGPFVRDAAVPALHLAWKEATSREAKQWLQTQYAPLDSLGKPMPESMDALLLEALEIVPKLVFYAGVAHNYEHALYAGKMPDSQANRLWWEWMSRYMGIAPGSTQLDAYRTPETLAMFWNEPVGSFDQVYGLALSYQLQEKAFRSERGYVMLQESFYSGAGTPWEMLQKDLGLPSPDMSALMARFAPLLPWLRQQHAGMTNTLPSWE